MAPTVLAAGDNKSLSNRAQALKARAIDFIPNADFRMLELSQVKPSLWEVLEQVTVSVPSDMPSHLQRLCETALLTAETETVLFRQMNYLKFLAAGLRERLDIDQPEQSLIETVEQLLCAAQTIRDRLIQANMRLAMSIVKKFVTPTLSFDEMLSEGTVTLMYAVERFDFDRGFRFSTYAYRSISRTAYQFVASAREEEARLTRDADEWAFEQTEEQASLMPEQLWEGLRQLTKAMLQRLDRRERFIIRSRYALGSHRRVRSFQDLADRLGVSKERVRQIEAKAVAKLQGMARKLDLDEIRLTPNPT